MGVKCGDVGDNAPKHPQTHGQPQIFFEKNRHKIAIKGDYRVNFVPVTPFPHNSNTKKKGHPKMTLW